MTIDEIGKAVKIKPKDDCEGCRFPFDIEFLLTRIRELEQKQKWIDEVIRPDHPDDERPWASAYITCRQRIKELEDGIRKHYKENKISCQETNGTFSSTKCRGLEELYKLLEGK